MTTRSEVYLLERGANRLDGELGLSECFRGWHAGEKPVVGLWMLKELRHHGYDVSPGTLYPLLQRMESHGWLVSKVDKKGGARARREYYLTDQGRAVLDIVRNQLAELSEELKAAEN